MSRRVCAYCGLPIYKFVIGWLHERTHPGFLPSTAHIARPRRTS